jgi:hypothetical protein
MGARGCALILILTFSKFAFGQTVDLPDEKMFKAYLADEKRHQDEKVEVFVPLTLETTNSQNGIYQQVLNHQLQQMQAYGLPVQRFQRWDGRLTLKSAGTARDPTGTMTFQAQPITQQGSINFQDIGRVSLHYQIFLHQSEYRFTPFESNWSFSHVDTQQDSQNRLFYGWQW